ncbi:11669_t:CDS:2 [Acaulospora morrowiae]|uniref:histone deacetylase n=1 Tax=Acaulospora morrowiae TaxID=94023 RepID=A0A9N9DZY4_9GLOM|nr:11669_t:CDS:2 [Acaulospora morrowiae]
MATKKAPIVYHPSYNITFWNLEKKYKNIHRFLIESGLFTINSFHEPSPPTPLDLEDVHSKQYLDSLNSNAKLQRILEVPFVTMLPHSLVKKKVLEPMLLQTGGSVLAAELALENGWGINLGGGFHHAHYNDGGGFCVYADITLIVKKMLSNYPDKVSRVMIIDLDAHQGNGHERDFAHDNKVHIIDAFNFHIYPQDRYAYSSITTPVRLTTPELKKDEKYLQSIQSAILQSFHEFRPNFVIYNAGTDCLEGDPLGSMNLSKDAILKRDELVFRTAISNGVPIVMLLSGGYQKKNAEIISTSILNIINKFGLLEKIGTSN